MGALLLKLEPIMSPELERQFVECNGLLKDHPDPKSPLKRGSKITFLAGNDTNIPMTYKIIGFEVQPETDRVAIYVNWSCYWSPIHEEDKRCITIVNDRLEEIAARIEALRSKN